MIERTCEICKIGFKVYPYRKTIARFCSNECRWKGIGKSISLAKQGHSHSILTRLKISKTLKAITPRGSQNRFWKNGLIPLYNKLRNSPKYRKWRNAVYKKNNWTCQSCKKKLGAGEIIAHHIYSFKKYLLIRFNINNGVTLYRKCHARLHKKYGDTIPLSYFS